MLPDTCMSSVYTGCDARKRIILHNLILVVTVSMGCDVFFRLFAVFDVTLDGLERFRHTDTLFTCLCLVNQMPFE